jgi:hypothetical protein
MQQQNIALATRNRGELRLPQERRHYVLRGTQVRDLLDSLHRRQPGASIECGRRDEAPVLKKTRVTFDDRFFERCSVGLKKLRAIKGHTYVVHVQ